MWLDCRSAVVAALEVLVLVVLRNSPWESHPEAYNLAIGHLLWPYRTLNVGLEHKVGSGGERRGGAGCMLPLLRSSTGSCGR